MSAAVALERHKRDLLAIPGCTAVAVGKKVSGGEVTDIECVVVFVARKGTPPNAAELVPTELGGVPTDVIEREFGFAPIATNPMERLNPIIGGISLTSYEDAVSYGSIGCFIAADGAVPGVPAGTYLLTNQHVVQVAAAPGADRRVLQPGDVNGAIPANYVCGEYVHGQRDASHDCAITSVVGRGWANEVPNHPWHPGNRDLTGLAVAMVGEEVYKYGSSTKHTVGHVTFTHLNIEGLVNAIYVSGENGGLWCNGGDSGSALVRYADDRVLGLNFRADTHTAVPGGFSGGLAYDITEQILVFSGVAALA